MFTVTISELQLFKYKSLIIQEQGGAYEKLVTNFENHYRMQNNKNGIYKPAGTSKWSTSAVRSSSRKHETASVVYFWRILMTCQFILADEWRGTDWHRIFPQTRLRKNKSFHQPLLILSFYTLQKSDGNINAQ